MPMHIAPTTDGNPGPVADKPLLSVSDHPARPLNLLFVVKSLAVRGGGAERVLVQVSSHLAERGHQVTLASFDSPSSQDFYESSARVRRIKLGVDGAVRPTSAKDFLVRMRDIRRLAARSQPDVVIGFLHSAYVLLGLALAGSGYPVVASEHIVFEHYRDKPLQAFLLRISAVLFTAYTGVSEVARNSFPGSIRKRMTVVPNPVSGETDARADVDPPGRKTLLTVGRLSAQKDHRTLVSAFAQLAPRYPDWDLRIVGEGELAADLGDQICTLGLEGRVTLPGATPDVAGEYSRAQLFVLPSTYESLGLATVEALAHGLPAIGFADCPGTNELIIDGINGLLVAGQDRVVALAGGLERLMSSPSMRRDMAANAPQSVPTMSIEAVAGEWEKLLTAVAGGRAPARKAIR